MIPIFLGCVTLVKPSGGTFEADYKDLRLILIY